MDAGTLVFRDATSSLENLIAQVQENPLRLGLDDVILEEPGHPIEGENWRPKLAPYKPWVHDAALDEADQLDGTDGDLLIVGALGMGISDEERMALIGDAVRGTGEEPHGPTAAASAEGSSRRLTPHELWTLGQTPRWQPKSAERSAAAAEGGAAGGGADGAAAPAGGCLADGDAAAAGGAAHCRETIDSIRETTWPARETLRECRETFGAEDAPVAIGDTRTEEAAAEGAGAGDAYFATNVPLQVRRDGEGYAVSAVHLGKLAEHGLRADNLIVVVPSLIDGVPVVRVTSEAFGRRFTSGAQVRLLVVPDTVEVLGAGAFGSVCAEVVHLGAGVRIYDPTPFDPALPNPRLEVRRYAVAPANERFLVEGGCLLERIAPAWGEAASTEAAPEGASESGGSTLCPARLLFAFPPYGERFAVPDGVRIMGAATFAKGVLAPRVIDAPLSLARVDGTVDPETIWLGENPAALARTVARAGGRVAGLQAVEQGHCWYDFADDADSAGRSGDVRGARLVAGPPAPDSPSRQFSSAAHARLRGASAVSAREAAANAASALAAPAQATDRLALPRTVGDAPLTVIAERALITAPATLVLPDTVREVLDGNACKGTRKLMLTEGLRAIGAHCFCSRTLAGPVLIPASVASIGEGSFEYAVVRFGHPDAEGAVVHVTSDQLMSCFLEAPDDGIPFDFARYDAQLLVGRGLPDHLGALLHRLAAPFRLAPDMRDRIVEALREQVDDAVQYVAREGDIACVRALAEAGFLDDAALFDRQIERLRASNRTDCVLFLMNWQHDRAEASRASAPKRARDRFAL